MHWGYAHSHFKSFSQHWGWYDVGTCEPLSKFYITLFLNISMIFFNNIILGASPCSMLVYCVYFVFGPCWHLSASFCCGWFSSMAMNALCTTSFEGLHDSPHLLCKELRNSWMHVHVQNILEKLRQKRPVRCLGSHSQVLTCSQGNYCDSLYTHRSLSIVCYKLTRKSVAFTVRWVYAGHRTIFTLIVKILVWSLLIEENT